MSPQALAPTPARIADCPPRITVADGDVTRVLHARRLYDLAEALLSCPDIVTVSVAAGGLHRCEICPDTPDWPALDAVATVAHVSTGSRMPSRDDVCAGCLTLVARRHTVRGNRVWFELPLLDAPTAPVIPLPRAVTA